MPEAVASRGTVGAARAGQCGSVATDMAAARPQKKIKGQVVTSCFDGIVSLC
jgi:hypothetical protein